MMVNLRSESVAVRIDPRHGGEVIDLIDLRSGRQLLGRPPFASDEPCPGELDETAWTRSYRGGWQLLVPNAGNPCVVDGVAHGFHGRTSTDAWEIGDHGESAATLFWAGHGLRIERSFSLAGDEVAVRSTVTAERTAELVWVEHIALGLELLDPSVEISIPGGQAYEVSEQTGPTRPPEDAGSWPEVRLLDGTFERAERASLTAPRSRLLIVAGLPEGRVAVHNRDRRQGIELAWDTSWLPHLWMWHEVRTSGGPWRGLAEMLVIEPASVPHTLGLDAARQSGHAHRLEAGEQRSTEIVIRPLLEDAI
jgi:hypothetical protein